jgi:hypothetical protein
LNAEGEKLIYEYTEGQGYLDASSGEKYTPPARNTGDLKFLVVADDKDKRSNIFQTKNEDDSDAKPAMAVKKGVVGNNTNRFGDPLDNMQIANAGNSGLRGGMYGDTRSSGTQFHGGMDFYAEQNTNLKSIADGVVISIFDKLKPNEYHSSSNPYSSNYQGGLGNEIQIKSTINGKTIVYRYCHLNQISVSLGDKVTKGQSIGKTGRNGIAGLKGANFASNEPHLHLQITVNGSSSDPMNYIKSKFNANGIKIK